MKQKFTMLLFLAAIGYANVFAQPRIRSQKIFGGNLDDIFTCIDLTSDGGYILGGYSWSGKAGDKSESSRGWYDYWVVKVDSSRKIQWDKTIGGNDADYLYTIQQTSDGGYILGGWSISDKSGEKTENSRGFQDYWVVKLNSKGYIQWDKTIGGSEGDELTCLRQTSDGGYILGGTSWSDHSNEKTENSKGYDDYWVVKLSSSGHIEWDKTIGGSGFDFLSSLQETSDGGYILGGSSGSNKSGDKTENDKGNGDYWVVKMNSAGHIEWDKTIGGNAPDNFSSLQQTSDGGYILGGSSWSNHSYDKSENRRGNDDYWVVKLSSSGHIKWDKTIGGNSYEKLHSLQETKDGGYVLSGYSTSNKSGDKTEDDRCGCGPFSYSYDYWIVKLNGQGKIEWDKTIGGPDRDGSDGLVVVREISKDQYVVGGASDSHALADKTKPSKGASDYWIVWLTDRQCDHTIATTSQNASTLVTQSINNKIFTVYPNPTKNILHIQTNSKSTFSLTNQPGKILFTKTIEGNGVINVGGIPAGLYYLKNNTTGAVQTVIISR